jgi:formylglycine-generating enzyme required for sulfatase activity
VTNDQWTTCVDHGRCRNLISREEPGDHPVVLVSWQEAQKYVDWLSEATGKKYRMLSEAEWEYVARAGTTTPHYWDEDKYVPAGADPPPIEPGHANCAECGNGDDIDDMGALPVGDVRFPPNQYGLCHILGNAWEFTADTAHPNYRGAPDNGSVWWSDEEDGPRGHRVARGGSFSSNASDLSASYRFRIKANDRYPGMGFRVARTLDAGSADIKPAEVTSLTRLGTADRRNTCQLEQPK